MEIGKWLETSDLIIAVLKKSIAVAVFLVTVIGLFKVSFIPFWYIKFKKFWTFLFLL